MISYSYLWSREAEQGAQEGLKNRPCAIVIARQNIEDHPLVTVVPITHSPPSETSVFIALPDAVKKHLGLDDEPSWIIVDEVNDFIWPGYDLRPVRGSNPAVYDYGVLPPRLFNQLRDKLLGVYADRKLTRTDRD